VAAQDNPAIFEIPEILAELLGEASAVSVPVPVPSIASKAE